MNLTEVVVRATDTLETLKEKVRLATILGTIQSTYTHFPYLRKVWKDNTEEERLLGVSLTGIMDNNILNGKERHYTTFYGEDDYVERDYLELPEVLNILKQVAIDTNAEWATVLGIPVSTAITCVR